MQVCRKLVREPFNSWVSNIAKLALCQECDKGSGTLLVWLYMDNALRMVFCHKYEYY